jgi:hypothetical protein
VMRAGRNVRSRARLRATGAKEMISSVPATFAIFAKFALLDVPGLPRLKTVTNRGGLTH